LPLGYPIPNVPITIDMLDPGNPENNDVRNIHGVTLEIQSLILDFSNLSGGDSQDTLKKAYVDSGILIHGYKKLGVVSGSDPPEFIVSPLDLMVFDSDAINTADPDLEVNLGNIVMIPHDDNDDGIPDNCPGNCIQNDSPNGGWQVYTFDPARFVNSLVFVDADRNNVAGSDIVTAYDDFVTDSDGNQDCSGNIVSINPDTNMPGFVQIQNAGDGSKQAVVTMGTEKTKCLKVQYMDSGAVARINLGCPLSDDFDV